MQPLLSCMSRSWNKASATCTRLGSSLHPQEGEERRKCFTAVLHPRCDTCSFLNSIKTHGVCHYCQCRWFPRAGMESRAKNQTEEKEQENRSSWMTWWSSHLLGVVGKPLTTTWTTAASPAWCLGRKAQTTSLEMRKIHLKIEEKNYCEPTSWAKKPRKNARILREREKWWAT